MFSGVITKMWEFPILKSKSRRGNEVIKVRRISVEPEKYKDCLVGVVGGGGGGSKKAVDAVKVQRNTTPKPENPRTQTEVGREEGVKKYPALGCFVGPMFVTPFDGTYIG